MMETTETELGRIDEAVMVIQQLKKRRMKTVKDLEKRLDLSENQKIFIGQEYDLWRNVDLLLKQVDGSLKANLGRIPPHARDLEEAVLGAIILERESLSKVFKFLKPEHFYEEIHKEIYMAILEVLRSNDPIDMRTVVNQLRMKGAIELVGGAYYIAELTAKVSSGANVEYHARILVEMAIKRSIILGASFIIQEAYENRRDCFVMLEYCRKAYNKIESWIK